MHDKPCTDAKVLSALHAKYVLRNNVIAKNSNDRELSTFVTT